MPSTLVPKRFVGTLDDSNIAAGANIATSKLAQAAEFVLRAGTVPFTGNVDFGNNRATNAATPSSSGDLTTKAYVDTLYNQIPQAFKYKGSAKASTTGNITIANPGTAVFDGITLSAGDILFVGAQTTTSEQGLYTFNGSGVALTRIGTMDTWAEVPGAMFSVEQGTVNADKIYICTSDQGGTIGTTAILFTVVNGVGLSNSNFVTGETPAGTINGSNTAFTLANTPVAGSECLHLGGIRLKSGAGNDYTISTNAITMLTAPLTGETFIADYRK